MDGQKDGIYVYMYVRTHQRTHHAHTATHCAHACTEIRRDVWTRQIHGLGGSIRRIAHGDCRCVVCLIHVHARPHDTTSTGPALASDSLHVHVVLLLRHVRPGEEEAAGTSVLEAILGGAAV